MPSECIGVHSQKNWLHGGGDWNVYSGFEGTHKH